MCEEFKSVAIGIKKRNSFIWNCIWSFYEIEILRTLFLCMEMCLCVQLNRDLNNKHPDVRNLY